MNVIKIIDAFGYVIYAALALLAVWGVYNAILLYRILSKKSLRRPGTITLQVRELCQARKFDAAISVCQSPAYWHTALCAADRRGPPKPRQRAGQGQAAPGHGVPYRGDRGDGEPAGVDLDDRPDGPAAGAAGNGRQHDRRPSAGSAAPRRSTLAPWPPTSAWRSGPPARGS